MDRTFKKDLLFLFMLSSVVFFIFLGSNGLMEPDEGRYSEIPREMIERGDYVTPTLNYVKYFEKPVLHYWLTAGAFKVFGENEFASRFWPALFSVLGVLVTYCMGRELYGRKSGLMAGGILLTSLLYFCIGQINLTDMPVSFFITLSLAGFMAARRREREWYLLFYSAMALATLTKGLIGIVLPCGVIFVYMVATRSWDIVGDALYLPGVGLFFLITVPWFWIVCKENSHFFHFFFIREHFLRYTTKIHDRYEPLWYFIPILIVGFLPWSGFLPRAIASFRGDLLEPQEKREAGLFLFIWFAFIFAFFSISGSKLIPYIIPIFPPLAVLMGHSMSNLVDSDDVKGLRKSVAINSLITIPLGLAFIIYPWLQDDMPVKLLACHTVHKGIILLAGTIITIILATKAEIKRSLLCLFITALLFTSSFKSVLFLYDRLNSSRQIARIIEKDLEKGDIIVQNGTFLEAIPFYLKRRNVIANYRGELDFGASQEKDPQWFIDDDGLKKLWSKNQKIFIIVPSGRATQLESDLAPLYEIGRDWREKNIIYTNKKPEEASKQ